ncbi:MAG: polysulfide reductase NrfD [Deltaproteobacteria bacterium]|nr:polysulfide reductase NrfD [Deltaproteobacteria bacterium]
MGMMVYTWFVYRKNQKWAKILGLISIVLAVCTHWYTGVVMQLNPGRDLNHTAMAALIFLTGAFVSGVGFMIFMLYMRNLIVPEEKKYDMDLTIELGRLMGYGIAFDFFLIFSEFLQMRYGTAEEILVLDRVLLGVFIWPFFWGQILIGLAIPLIIVFSPLGKKAWVVALIAGFLTFEGTWGMRVWWVLGGQFLQSFY